MHGGRGKGSGLQGQRVHGSRDPRDQGRRGRGCMGEGQGCRGIECMGVGARGQGCRGIGCMRVGRTGQGCGCMGVGTRGQELRAVANRKCHKQAKATQDEDHVEGV